MEEKIQISFKNFLINFVQAILNTRFYGPEHPKGRESLNKMLRSYSTWNEIQPESPIILTYNLQEFHAGFGKEYLPLNKLLTRSEMELYHEKLKEYFEKASLISFHINPGTDKRELTDLLTIFNKVYRGEVSRTRSLSEQINEWFREKKLTHITTLFNEDIIITRKDIPWKVRVVISRLNKDLKLLPYFHRHSEQLKEARLLSFRENLKLLMNPQEMLHFIRNINLLKDVGENYIQFFESSESIFEPEFIKKFLIFFQKNYDPEKDQPVIQVLPVFLNKLFTSHVDNQTRNVLQKFINSGIIEKSGLPPEIAYELYLDELLLKLENNPDSLISLWGEKIKKGEFEKRELENILQKLAESSDVDKMLLIVRKIVVPYRIKIEPEAAIKKISEKIEALDKESKEKYMKLCSYFPEISFKYLLDILKISSNTETRAVILSGISTIARSNSKNIKDELNAKDKPWYFYRNLLIIAGETGDETLLPAVEPYLYYPDARVKKAAFQAIVNLKGINVLPIALKIWESNISGNIKIVIEELISHRILSKWFLNQMLPVYLQRWENFEREKEKINIETEYIREAFKAKKIDAVIIKKIVNLIIRHSSSKGLFKKVSGEKREELQELIKALCYLPQKDKKIIIRVMEKNRVDKKIIETLSTCM